MTKNPLTGFSRSLTLSGGSENKAQLFLGAWRGQGSHSGGAELHCRNGDNLTMHGPR